VEDEMSDKQDPDWETLERNLRVMWEELAKDWQEKAEAQLAENNRLRAALEQIWNMRGGDKPPPGWRGDEYLASKLNRIVALAYEALKGGE
jgi:hypothetical protein